MPAGKPPRIHIVVVYAKDRMIGGNPDPARTNAKTIDLKCDTNQFFLWEDRTLDVAKKRVGGRLAMAYLMPPNCSTSSRSRNRDAPVRCQRPRTITARSSRPSTG